MRNLNTTLIIRTSLYHQKRSTVSETPSPNFRASLSGFPIGPILTAILKWMIIHFVILGRVHGESITMKKFPFFAFIFSLIFVPPKVFAQEATDVNAAIAYYAFRYLESMPILENRGIGVGDVIVLRNEDILASAHICYPSLQTALEQGVGDDGRSHTIKLSLDALGSLSSKAELARIVEGDVELRALYERSASVFFSDVVAHLPRPDIQALFTENVKKIARCQPTIDVLASNRYDWLLVTRLYMGTVNAGFVLNTAGEADINAAVARIGKHVSDASVQMEVEGKQRKVSLSKLDQGTIAVQSSRLDANRLAEAWILMEEDVETVAQLEGLVREYLGNDDYKIRKNYLGRIINFLEKFGLFSNDFEEYRLSIFGSENSEIQSLDEIPDEHWRATAALAASLVIVDGNI
jgi:hypothetical protein